MTLYWDNSVVMFTLVLLQIWNLFDFRKLFWKVSCNYLNKNPTHKCERPKFSESNGSNESRGLTKYMKDQFTQGHILAGHVPNFWKQASISQYPIILTTIDSRYFWSIQKFSIIGFNIFLQNSKSPIIGGLASDYSNLGFNKEDHSLKKYSTRNLKCPFLNQDWLLCF